MKDVIQNNFNFNPSETANFERRYDLDQDALGRIAANLIARTGNEVVDDVAVVWLDPRSVYANFVRTREAEYFPEVSNLDEYYDFAQEMFVIVDTRKGIEQVSHALTLMPYQGDSDNERTGFYTIDSLIGHGNFTKEEFVDFYTQAGINLQHCACIETNFRISKLGEKYKDLLSAADLAYLTVFNKIIAVGGEKNKSAVFATVNNVQRRSLEAIGLTMAPLMGRNNFITEEAEMGVESTPVVIGVDQYAIDFFGSLGVQIKNVD